MTTTYGSKYAATRDLDTAAVAKLFRADVKAAIKAGTLPAALKLSVKTSKYAGGSSIDLDITRLPAGFPILNVSRTIHDQVTNYAYTSEPRYSPEFCALTTQLEAMLAAYNYDGSDAMSDYYHVRFGGGHCGVDHVLEALDRAAILAIAALATGEEPIIRDAAQLGEAVPEMVPAADVVADYPRGLVLATAAQVSAHALARLAAQARALDAAAA